MNERDRVQLQRGGHARRSPNRHRVALKITCWGGINVIGKYAGSLLRIIAESVETNCAHQCAWVWLKVARDGIEPPTQGFSVLCSTN
ncbi:MAG: hypothetical protein JWN13_3333 [Betaproteobacteria bacterium]|jgi:hypothetical protein|nr:hypothetical protein [Betaproteobacteria bacterium]